MSFIEVTENELVHIKEIDSQHKKLTEIVNSIHNSIGNNRKIKKLVSELTEFSFEHFDTEDRLMIEYKDPNYISHKLEHDRMRKLLGELNSQVQDGTKTLGILFVQNYKKWFGNHNRLNDQKTAAHLKSKGVK